MASGSAVQVEILASFGDFQAGLAKAAQSMQQMTRSMSSSMATLPAAVKPASEAFGGLEHSLKAFKSEQVQQGRMVGFYVRELVEFTGAAGATKTAMGGMLSAAVELMGGLGPLGIALASFEVLKTISVLWRESGEAAKKAAELAEKTWTTKMEGAKSAVESVKKATMELLGLDPQAIQNAKDLIQKNREIAALRKADPGGLQWQEMDRLKKERGEIEEVAKAYREAKAARDAAQAIVDAPRVAQEGAAMAADLQAEITDDEQKEFARREALYYAHLDRTARAYEKSVAEERTADKESSLEYGRALDAREKRRSKYATEIAGLERQEEERSQRAAQAVGQSVSRVMGSILMGKMSAADALKSLGASLVQLALDAAATEIVAHLMGKPAKIAEATAQAGLVGAGTAAALASNPITALAAIPAGAAAMAEALGLFVPVAAASGGFDVGNFNPLTQLHAREMVLPADLADNVRSMTGGGGRATINISALDTQSVERGLVRSDSQVMRALRKMQRRIG